MSTSQNLRISKHAMEIIERDLKDPEERQLVTQILNNYFVRGLLWWEDELDEVIAVTELIVLTNCLRNLHDKRRKL